MTGGGGPEDRLREFLRMEARSEERLEFHDGVVVAMAAPSLAHQRIVQRLGSLLEARLAPGDRRPMQSVKICARPRTGRLNVMDQYDPAGKVRMEPERYPELG